MKCLPAALAAGGWRHVLGCLFLACVLSAQAELRPRELVTREVAPERIVRNGETLLVDFGREAFGYVEVKCPVGATGAFVIGELTNAAGCVANPFPGSSVRVAKVTAQLAAGEWTRLPLVADKRNTSGAAVRLPERFGVVMPLRYLEADARLFPPDAARFRFVAVNYPIDMGASSFACSDKTLERLYGFCKHSVLATSFLGVYVDGDRERIAYEGDALVNQLSDYAISADYAMARRTHEHLMVHPTWPTEYFLMSVMLAWNDWMWSGDLDSARRCYDRLKDDKLMMRFSRADGLLETGTWCARTNGCADMVDWPMGERDGFVMTNVNAVINAFYYQDLGHMSDLAKALGKSEDAAFFAQRRKIVHEAYQKAFFDSKAGLYVDGEGAGHSSQHANVAALACGLVPSTREKAVADFVVAKGMSVSVYYSQFLLEALFRANRADAAIALMTSGTERSWQAMERLGATITLEAWGPKFKPNLDYNHAWGTPPLNVIARFVLGVTPAEPGWSAVRIRPQVGPLQWVRGTVPTPKGPVTVEVRDGQATFQVPKGMRVVQD